MNPHRSAWMTEDHEIFRDAVRKFFDSEFVPHRERWIEQGHPEPEAWRKAGEAVCLDPGCFDRKAEAGWARAMAEHEAAGGRAAPAAAVNQWGQLGSGFVSLADDCYQAGCGFEILGHVAEQPQVTIIAVG